MPNSRLLWLGLFLCLATGLVSQPAEAQQSISRFQLINADTDTIITGFNPIPNNATLNLATLPTTNLNIRAVTSPATVGSVRFDLDGTVGFAIEGVAPYALAGDVSGNYNAWTPPLGGHTLTATPFTGSGATGTAGTPLTINFTVVNQPAGGNQAPVVDAGSNQTITLPTTQASLNATVTDDGLPAPPALTYAWTQTGGPAGVTFGTPTAEDTTATFPGAGTYTLRLTANDGALPGADEVTVTVNPAGGGPAVTSFTLINANTDQPIAGFNPIANGATLNFATLGTTNLSIRANTSPATVGSVRFGLDGNPNFATENIAPYAILGDDPPGNYIAWTPSLGGHTLTGTPFTGSGGGGTQGTALTISFTVVNQAGGNQPPVVDAGSNQTITLPTTQASLNATVTDDGLPAPPALTYAWTQTGGPAGVTFGTPTAEDTTATFPGAGTYTLRLTANDGALPGADEVTVTVNPAGGGQAVTSFTLINADTDQVIAGFDPIPNGATLNFATLGTSNLSIRANTSPATVGSVRFGLDGNPNFATENIAPYAILGDNGAGNYNPWTPAQGDHTLTGTPFTGSGGGGTQGTALTINFTVVNQPVGTTVRLNSGGLAYTDIQGRVWAADAHFVGGATFSTGSAIGGTADDTLYQTERFGDFSYAIPVTNGTYQVTLHFAELFHTGPGDRVFDVFVENAAVLSSFDIFAEVGQFTALTRTFVAHVSDGTLNLDFLTVTDSAEVVAIEVLPVATAIRINAGGGGYTDALGHVWAVDQAFTGGDPFEVGTPIAGTVDDTLYQTERFGVFSYAIPVPNGTYEVTLHFAEIFFTAPNQRVFDVAMEGGIVLNNFDVVQQAGEANTAISRTITVDVNDGALNVAFTSVVENPKLSAIEVIRHEPTGHPFLHVVIEGPSYVVDYNGNGSQAFPLDGSFSHTHEPGRNIVSRIWKEGATTLGTTPMISPTLTVGQHTIQLTIGDDGAPPETLADEKVVNVYPITAVGGVITTYHPGSLSIVSPAPVGFQEVRPALRVDAAAAKIGGSPYTSDTTVIMTGTWQVATAGTYTFQLVGGAESQLFVDGTIVTGPRSLSAGSHTLEARFAISSAGVLPAEVLASLTGPPQPIAGSALAHNETSLDPFINTLVPASGSESGGEVVTIQGIGFFTTGAGQVTVDWNGTTLSGGALTINASGTGITLVTPAGTGTVPVTVTTPNGTSNAKSFTYVQGAGAVSFQTSPIFTLTKPTQAAWGPDGRLYVVSEGGTISILTFNDNYEVQATQTVTTLESASNHFALGIAFNPFDPPSPVKMYVAHSNLFAQGGACFTGVSPYQGQVSVLTGPNFTTATPLITGLPVSNHDHGVNGLEFDHNGDLLIAVGGNTNAGVAGDCQIGQLPESPLAASIVRARLSKGAGFNGTVTYQLAPGVTAPPGFSATDQNFGEVVTLTPGAAANVEVFASGLRNPFDLVLTTSGRIYSTDNGPNFTFGQASTGPTTQTSDPEDFDELNLVELGDYYGHPNRSRGRANEWENVYHGNSAASDLDTFISGLALFSPSTNGITEYRAQAFGGAMRGDLVAQQLGGVTYRVRLTADGRSVEENLLLTDVEFDALDVLTGPGGVLIGVSHGGDAILVAKPVDPGASGVTVYDIHPWRGVATGGTPFVIGGSGFGTLANTSVTIGGTAATLTSVTATRIKGTIPAKASPTAALLDVVVTVSGQSDTLPAAFRYLFPLGQENTGAQATVTINPGGTLTSSSTFTTGSFVVQNTSTAGQTIERVRIDLRGSLLRDQVFDPFGAAGDPVGKVFTADSGGAATGLIGPQYVGQHDEGFDILDVRFSAFGPTESFSFSIDADPTSIKDAPQPGPNDSGSVSGVELIGARVTVYFSDGTMRTGEPFRIPLSDTGSTVTLASGLPAAPGLTAIGLTPPQLVPAGQPNQTMRVTGPVGASVKLLRVEGGRFLAGVPGGGFDLDPFEANMALVIQEYTGTIGAGGILDIPVTLTKQAGSNGGTIITGYNHFVATIVGAGGATGRLSPVLILQLQ